MGVVYQNRRMAGALRVVLSSPVTMAAAPPGFGKTEAVRSFLRKRKTVRSVWTEGAALFSAPEPDESAELTILVVDAADLAGGETLRRALSWTEAGGERRLVLLCRSVTPALAPLLYEQRCAFVGKEDLAFTRDEAAEYFQRRGLLLTQAVWEAAEGWPMLLHLCADYGGVLSEACRLQIREYVRNEVLPSLAGPVREALLRLPERNRRTERLLLEYARDGLLEYAGGEFRVHPQLRAALEEEDALLFGARQSTYGRDRRLSRTSSGIRTVAKITG